MGTLAPVLLLFLSLVAAGEVIRRLRVLARFVALGQLGQRAASVLARKGSDHCKERATRILAVRMMAASLDAGAALILVVAPVVLLLLADGPLPLGVQAAFLDWQARMWLLLIMVGYVVIRWRIGQQRLQPR